MPIFHILVLPTGTAGFVSKTKKYISYHLKNNTKYTTLGLDRFVRRFLRLKLTALFNCCGFPEKEQFK